MKIKLLIARLASPVVGRGFGNIDQALYSTSKHLSGFVQYQSVDSSHNIFLDWWVQGGIVGLILFISLILLSIKRLIKNYDVVKLTSFIGILTTLSFNPASIASLIHLWWLLV